MCSREDMPILVNEQDRAVAAVRNKLALGLQLLKRAGTHKIRDHVSHRCLI